MEFSKRHDSIRIQVWPDLASRLLQVEHDFNLLYTFVHREPDHKLDTVAHISFEKKIPHIVRCVHERFDCFQSSWHSIRVSVCNSIEYLLQVNIYKQFFKAILSRNLILISFKDGCFTRLVATSAGASCISSEQAVYIY